MDEQQRAEFGRRVRDARVARGWNQIQLADAAGVAPNTVGSIELGKRSPQPQSVAAVMAALDLDPSTGVAEVPADVALVAELVTLWMLEIPAAKRARAVSDLVQFLHCPVDDEGEPVELERPDTEPARKTTARGFTARQGAKVKGPSNHGAC